MATKTVEKNWGDETPKKSHIEGLSLPSDRRWEYVTIEAKGTEYKQNFHIALTKNGKQKIFGDSFTLSDGQTWKKEVKICDVCSLAVSGVLSVWGMFPPAGGWVKLTGDHEEFELVTKKWSDEPTGKSFIEGMELPADHRWDHVTVTCTGHKNKNTGVSISLIAGGELVNWPLHCTWNVMEGTQSVTREFAIQKKTSLALAGYITNYLGVGGGADIEMTAYYRKGE